MKKLQTMNSASFRFKPIDGYISEYFNKTHVNYIYNLYGNNINATLYKLDKAKSTVTDGAFTKLQTLGPDSPYRFNEIVNVPIFNVSRVDIPMGWTEESGYSTEIRIEATVQPSIVPIEVDDYVVLDYSSYDNLWRVAEASPDAFEEIYYTKITLVPTPYTKENITFQISKRMAYIFETGAVIDRTSNDTLNDILSQLSNYYKSFLAEFYANQGLFIDPKVLSLFPNKYFSFKSVPTETKIYNYFFKKYISTTPITVYVDQKEPLEVFFKFNNIEEFIKNNLTNDDSILLLIFMYNLEKNDLNSKALDKSYKYMLKRKEKETNLVENEEPQFESQSEFYTILLDVFKAVETTDIIIDPNARKTVKIFSNLKKLINLIIKDSSSEKMLKSVFLFYLVKALPFKNVTFGHRNLDYGV